MSEEINKERERLIKEMQLLYERIDAIRKQIGKLNSQDVKR
jgi:hypothetical protein